MKKYKANIILLLLFPLSLLLNYLAALNPDFIEKYYSTRLNRFTIEIISGITEFIPFSLYEITVISAIVGGIIYFVYTFVMIIKHKGEFKSRSIKFILNSLGVLSLGYFLFIGLWGLNYNRAPLYETFGMENNKYTVKELRELYEYLIEEVNTLRELVPEDNTGVATVNGGYESVLKRAPRGYEAAAKEFNVFQGDFGTPKKLLFSEFFNYAGITGIYFPYSGQPGVNVNAPLMTMPATTLHEIAHQSGFAREDEANFIAFLVSTTHPDVDFQYSGYTLAMIYTGNALYKEDPDLYRSLSLKKSEEVERDRVYRVEFWDKYQGKIEKASSNINNAYLKSNGVTDGEKSYGRMVDLLLNYYMEYIK